MDKKIIKRSYNFSSELVEAWEKFHSPSKEFSPSAAAAFLLYMVTEPAIREALRKFAYWDDIEKAKLEARKTLRETIVNSYLSGFIGIHSDEDKKILLENYLKQTKEGQYSMVDKKTLGKIAKMGAREFSIVYKLLNQNDQRTVDEIRDKHKPDEKKQQKAG